MKFLATQVTYFLSQNETRQNIKALFKYVILLFAFIAVYSILFHFLMAYEGRYYSWITGLYWTLTVMSTLGFGDITFESDLGRLFSVIVLISGIILLLIMLPFAFIRFFYAPWLEAQIHTQAPREVPPGTEGHVIICHYDSITPNLIKRLKHNKIPYFVMESDAAKAAELLQSGISVIHGYVDSRTSFDRINVKNARLVVANGADTTNTNTILTVRETAPDVPIAATAEAVDSIDILELSGATHVLPLKRILGEHLANRISVGNKRANVIGKFDEWLAVEFTVHETPVSGLKIRETQIREKTGVNIIGVWERGHLTPAAPDKVLSNFSVPVGVGTKEQIEKLEEMLKIENSTPDAVLILGGGKVGRSAGVTLKEKDLKVYMVELKEEMRGVIGDIPDRLVIGDAADCENLFRAGLKEVSLVILSTNQDEVNIYLSIYCRRLKPDIRIVSRITHTRNLEAIHRAGADFVLSYAPLGAEWIMSQLQGREPVILGEGVEFFTVDLPQSLANKTLAQSRIGALTGMIVLAVESNGETTANPPPDMILPKGSKLNILGTTEQLQEFKKIFK
ncbi:MAG: NAD-binding protein [Pyrinomonadaceae bacterium]|nr:NAD-binding protein [Pyrinomonadaceae bacterium]